MVDKGKKHPQRSGIAARFDEVTLAAFTVLLLVTGRWVLQCIRGGLDGKASNRLPLMIARQLDCAVHPN